MCNVLDFARIGTKPFPVMMSADKATLDALGDDKLDDLFVGMICGKKGAASSQATPGSELDPLRPSRQERLVNRKGSLMPFECGMLKIK